MHTRTKMYLSAKKPKTRCSKLNPDDDGFSPSSFASYYFSSWWYRVSRHRMAYMVSVQTNVRIEVRNHASRKWILNCFKWSWRLNFSAHSVHEEGSRRSNTTLCVMVPWCFRAVIAIAPNHKLSWNARTTIRSQFDGYQCLNFGFVQGANTFTRIQTNTHRVGFLPLQIIKKSKS